MISKSLKGITAEIPHGVGCIQNMDATVNKDVPILIGELTILRRKEIMGLLLMIFLMGGFMLDNNFENKDGILYIGGVSVEKLKDKYQTPLYIFDQKSLKNRTKAFVDNFKSLKFDTEVVYATKAFSNLYVLSLLNNYNILFDCVSKEEIFVCLKAGVDSSRIHFHGNNKSKDELEYAIDKNIGLIIIDSVDEYYLLDSILNEKNKKIDVLIRINPDVKTDTHKFIQTSNADSKFGLNIRDKNTKIFISKSLKNKNMHILGFHAHIGSQVKNLDFFKEEAKIMLKYMKEIEEDNSYKFSHINLGGGFGTKERIEDRDLDIEVFLKDYIKTIENLLVYYKINIKNVGIEPGRSLISKSGSMLYTIGSTKKTLEGFPLIFVDGGMSDNIRPSLYDAKYSSILANKLNNEANIIYRVGGKLCESGDILIDEVKLPKVERDDLLLIPYSGAYTYSMASNYNKQRKAAVVFVEDGCDYLAVRRESLDDLISRDEIYKGEINERI
ncbi:diaminopimelate decarboxylase [Anaerococcus sp. WCA-380-WT-2B]|uniref:Diaminopimelate decarboxylase n=2 Tax=Anaerococcus porci TaxID=2652269 RepID=A0A6N7VQN2_9FIRM|nr:diaminopimelate decarboxylase [Anaerococcus porci]